MLIGASWGRVINDIAREKGMTRKEVFFQADMLGNIAGGTNTAWESVIDPEDLVEEEVLDAVKIQMESKDKTKH